MDALWMSAKRGSDTLQLSVADGRALLTGLLSGLAPPSASSPSRRGEIDPDTGLLVPAEEVPPRPLVDLDIPLPRALAALTAARAAGPAGRSLQSQAGGGEHQKPLRPVLVGASGPFARAAREAGRGGGGGSVRSGSSHGGGSSVRSGSSHGGSSRRSGSRSHRWVVRLWWRGWLFS